MSSNEKELQELILQLNNSYADWNKVQHMHLSMNGITQGQVWEKIKQSRNQGFTRQIVLGEYTFSWSVSNAMEEWLHEMDIIAGATDKLVNRQKKQHPYFVNALIEESLGSAQLAGLVTSKKAARELLLKKKIPANTHEQAIQNIYTALKTIHVIKHEKLDRASFLQLHAIVIKNMATYKATGRFRTNNKYDTAFINTEAAYKAPESKSLDNLMQEVYDFFNEDKKPFFIHPIIKAAIIQYLVTFIRPFKDGNGRMARMLAYWYLLRKNYEMMQYVSTSAIIYKFKLPYPKSFVQVQRDKDVGYFIHLQLQALRMAVKSVQEQIKKTQPLKLANAFSAVKDINERQAAVLQWLLDDAEKVITIRELRSAFGVSKETARTDLTILAEKNWLQYFNLNKKTYAFIKSAAFDTLYNNMNHG